MAIFETTILPVLGLAFMGYVLGSIPVAAIVSRTRGVDIFSTGTRLAGAANVARNVGNWHGVAVFAGDAGKGILTVMMAIRLGAEGSMILVPATAALAGHWKSVFTRFRGGDGLSTLVGITVAALPAYSIVVVVTGGVVALIARRTGHPPTLWGGIAAYSFLLIRAPISQDNTFIDLGIVCLALMVLIHGLVGHRRRRLESD
jgi:acyl-phosphate glycerol 3-phosphate acyltransferase